MNLKHRFRGAAVVCLADAKPGTPPTEFRIFPAGGFASTKGPFVFDELCAKTVLADRAIRGVKVRLDYEHASLNIEDAKDPAEAGKAAGWFSIELRDGALWAIDVKWTPVATQKITDHEFL